MVDVLIKGDVVVDGTGRQGDVRRGDAPVLGAGSSYRVSGGGA